MKLPVYVAYWSPMEDQIGNNRTKQRTDATDFLGTGTVANMHLSFYGHLIDYPL